MLRLKNRPLDSEMDGQAATAFERASNYREMNQMIGKVAHAMGL